MMKSCREVASERKVPGAIRSLQLQCANILYEKLLISVLKYGRDNDNEVEGKV